MAMKVKEAEHALVKKLNERIMFNPAVTSVVRKQYLESARGHFMNALAGKQERANFCHNVDAYSAYEDNAMEEATVEEKLPILGELGQAKTFAGIDMQSHLPHEISKESDRGLQAKVGQFSRTLQSNINEQNSINEQISEVISRIGVSGQEMEIVDASEPEDSTTVLPELVGSKDSPLKGLIEGSSLQRMVKSLKVELENLKKEHAELKDRGAGAEYDMRSLQNKLFKGKFGLEGSLAIEPQVEHTSEMIAQDQHNAQNQKFKAKGRKRENESAIVSEEAVKRHKVDRYFDNDKAKDAMVSTLDQAKCIPGKMYDASVSTSESSARVIFSEDELESSSKKAEKSDKVERSKYTVVKGRLESANVEHSSEFSIRDYVFAARNKDISINWPFSQKNLQLCLKRGLKDVLPPFQSMESLGDSSMKRCFTDSSSHSEESKLDERPVVQKIHLVAGAAMNHQWNPELADGYRDSDLFPSLGEKELAFKSTVMAQSEVESVSTSNLPLSEVSDEQVAAASAVNKSKSFASQPSNKKCKMAVKVHLSSSRGAPDDITSVCTVPSEAMASKVCPVCETFSSSSNTTLNAHIDQCLSSQSTPNWMKNSNLVKPRIKPRKMRSMVDICATAPRCTLEDLDRRNGTNWATNAEFPSEDTEVITQGKNCVVSTRHVNNGDDGAVYIDSAGRKIRILSKFNDKSPSSPLPKAKEDLRSKKLSKTDKISRFFSSKRKRRFGKHLKFLKVTHQRKRLSYRTMKGRLNEVRGTAEASSALGGRHGKEQQRASFFKAQRQKNASVSGTLKLWISSKRSNLSKKNDSKVNGNPCRQASDDLQPGSDHLNNERVTLKKPSSSEKSFPCLRSGVGTRTSYQAGIDQKSESSSGSKTFCSPSMEGTTLGDRESCLVRIKPGVVRSDGRETVSRPIISSVSLASSFEGEDEIQADTLGNADSSILSNRKFSDSSHELRCVGIRSNDTEVNMLKEYVVYIHNGQSTVKQKGPAIEQLRGCRRNGKGDTLSAEIRQQSEVMPDYQTSKVTNSNGCSIKLWRKREFECDKDVSGDSKGTCGLSDESHDNHDSAKSGIIGLYHEREVITPISTPGFANGEAVTNSRRPVDLESLKVVDVPEPLPKSVLHANPLPNSGQPSPSDDHEMFHKDVGPEGFELKAGVPDFNVDLASSFPEVDPIPIPGPPGSDLPSFSDMGSEDLHRSSLLDSSLAQTSVDGDGGDDENQSDSPLSATSTISNLGITEDPTVSISEGLQCTPAGSNNVYPGWWGASFGPSMETSEIFSVLAVTGRDRTPPLAKSPEDRMITQGRCHSIPEGCSWSAALNFEESQLLRQRMETSMTLPVEKHVDSILNERTNCSDGRNTVLSLRSLPRGESENLSRSSETSCQCLKPMEVSTGSAVSFSRSGDCDSANPAPILRLMGKDLMVMNKAKDDISTNQVVQNCTNRQVLPVSEFRDVFSSWQEQPPQGMVYNRQLVHQHVPDTFSWSSDMINNLRSPKQLSQVSMYFDKNMPANFSFLGAEPLQR